MTSYRLHKEQLHHWYEISLKSGKRKEVRTGKKLADRSQYPLNIVFPENNLKLNMDLSADANVFTLMVNNRDYYQLPYRFDLTQEGITCRGLRKIKFNQKEIKVPENWSNREFIKNFLDDNG